VVAGIVNGYQRLCDRLTKLGVPCIMTGGETADVGDLVRTLIVDSTIAVRLRRDEIIDAGRMQPGDVIVGYSSTGQATWEDVPNYGMGSNGLTSARHELLGGDYRARYSETFAPEVDPALVYCGKFKVSDPLPGDPSVTVGKAILSPTRTYLPLIRDLIDRVGRSDLHGLIHCSGGGQSKIVKFGRPGNRYVKDTPFAVPPFFAALKEGTGQRWNEMYSVYNMGWRLEAVVPASAVAACLAAGTAAGIHAQVVGRVEQNSDATRSVLVSTPDGVAEYR